MLKQLPYKWLAGITPCPKGWLIIPARLAGVTVVVEDPYVLSTLMEVVDSRPKFDAAAINIPMGFNDVPTRNGPVEAESKELIGWPRQVAIRPIPARQTLKAPSKAKARELEPWLTNDDFRRFRWLRQSAETFQPFHQRNFFSANPDLSYTQLNEDRPLKTSPFHQEGVVERMTLIRNKLPGVEEVIMRTPPVGAGQYHVVQAAGLLWTARRASGRAINRLPAEPGWDESGLRVELVR